MEGIELISFEIISNVGTAKSLFIEAINLAKSNKIEEAYTKIEVGEQHFLKGHHAHAKLVQQEAAGENFNITMLLLHAEDQLMSAESFKILSKQFIQLYEEISKLGTKINVHYKCN